VSSWLVALIVTLVIETPIVVACYPRERARIAVVAVLANVATNLLLNLVLVSRGHLVMGELIALVVETASYAVASRDRDVVRALAASAAANLASFALGPVLACVVFR
jgi:O-antigen/teichoic acid export membrane protein